MPDSLGVQIRRARLRRGWTLDVLAEKSSISKPYLSLIENQHVHNPSDEKLRRLEKVLGFAGGELLHQAHLHRTPVDIRTMLASLAKDVARRDLAEKSLAKERCSDGSSLNESPLNGNLLHGSPLNKGSFKEKVAARMGSLMNLDAAYLSGVLQQMVDSSAGNVESIRLGTVPVINRVSAGYPEDFTDLSYPRGVADDYIGCPNLDDPDAFAARVHGDSMSPKYTPNDVVIFSPAANPRDGDDCFVRFDDGRTTFKRVYFETNSAGEEIVRLQPRNERYASKSVPRASISGVYRAVYRYQVIDNTR